MPALSACTYDCPDACSFLLKTGKDGRLRVTGNPDHPFTRGVVCSKGAGLPARLARPDRIATPLLRRGGTLEPVSWDQALDLVAEKIAALRERPAAILHLRGFGYRGVLAEASKCFFATLGASGTFGSLCDETGIAACLKDFGALDHNDPLDLVNARRIVNWGKDLGRSSLHSGLLVNEARKAGARVLTISPGGDANAPFSDEFLRIRPGADRFLALAAARLLLERGAVPARVRERSANFPAFEALALSRSVADWCAACDCAPEGAKLLCSYLEGEEPTSVILGWGVQRHPLGGQNVRAINALAVAAGQVGRPGAGAFFNIGSGRNLATWWDQGLNRGRRLLSLPLLGRDLAAADPAVELVFLDGTNAVNQLPDCGAVLRGLARAFVVAVEAFPNDTVAAADLVLPPALCLEREDILGSCLHNLVNHSAKVMDPPGQARSDFDILADLGSRLDPPVVFPDKEACLRAALASPWLDASLDEIREKGFARAKRPPVAFPDLVFGHPDGKYRFLEAADPEEAPDPAYPLRLLTLVRKDSIHSQTPPEEQIPPVAACVAPDCPALAGLDLTRPVFLATSLGRMPVRPVMEPGLHPGAVVVRRGGWSVRGCNANPIIPARETDMGSGAAFYGAWARLEN